MVLTIMLLLAFIPSQQAVAASKKVYRKGSVYYVKEKGKVKKYTGFYKIGSKRYYISSGKRSKKTGFVTSGKNKYYLRSGWNAPMNGLVRVSNSYYYVKKGVLQSNFTGFLKSGKYIKRGKHIKNATGIVSTGGKKYYIKNGNLYNTTGFYTIGGVKYFLNKGNILTKTGFVTVKNKSTKKNETYYLKNGHPVSSTGIVSYDGSRYYIVRGIRSEKTGFVKTDDGTYYMTDGKVSTLTGVQMAKGKVYTTMTPDHYVDDNGIYQVGYGVSIEQNISDAYYLKNGKKTADTGVFKNNDGNMIYVKNGKWIRCVNGSVIYNKIVYDIKDGIAVSAVATDTDAVSEPELSYSHKWEVKEKKVLALSFCNTCGFRCPYGSTHQDDMGVHIEYVTFEDGTVQRCEIPNHAGYHSGYFPTEVTYICTTCGEERIMETDIDNAYDDPRAAKYKDPNGYVQWIVADGKKWPLDTYMSTYLKSQIK